MKNDGWMEWSWNWRVMAQIGLSAVITWQGQCLPRVSVPSNELEGKIGVFYYVSVQKCTIYRMIQQVPLTLGEFLRSYEKKK